MAKYHYTALEPFEPAYCIKDNSIFLWYVGPLAGYSSQKIVWYTFLNILVGCHKYCDI